MADHPVARGVAGALLVLVLVGLAGLPVAAQGAIVVPGDAATGWDHETTPPDGFLSGATWCFALDPALAGQELTGLVDGPDGPVAATGTVGGDGVVEVLAGIRQGGPFTLGDLALGDGTTVDPGDVATNTVAFDPPVLDCTDLVTPVAATPSPEPAPASPSPSPSQSEAAPAPTEAPVPTEGPVDPPAVDPFPAGSGIGWVALGAAGVASIVGGAVALGGTRTRGGGGGTGARGGDEDDEDPRDVDTSIPIGSTGEGTQLYDYDLRLTKWDVLHQAMGNFPGPADRKVIADAYRGKTPASPWHIERSYEARLYVAWRIVRDGSPEPGYRITVFDAALKEGAEKGTITPSTVPIVRTLDKELTAAQKAEAAKVPSLSKSWAELLFPDKVAHVVKKRDRPAVSRSEDVITGQLVTAVMVLVPPAKAEEKGIWATVGGHVDTFIKENLAKLGAAAGTAIAPGAGTAAGYAGGKIAEETWSALVKGFKAAFDGSESNHVIPVLSSSSGGVDAFRAQDLASPKSRKELLDKATAIPLDRTRSDKGPHLSMYSDDEILWWQETALPDGEALRLRDFPDPDNDDGHWTLFASWRAELRIVRAEAGKAT